MMDRSPLVGFHFVVFFELFPQLPSDLCFQQVSGLSVNLETEDYIEGGENRFVHQLPARTTYSPLELRRGILVGSGLISWFREAIENFNFRPTNATISLLNDMHLPVSAWYVTNVFPRAWSIAEFNAQADEVAIESMQLHYDYFKTLRV